MAVEATLLAVDAAQVRTIRYCTLACALCTPPALAHLLTPAAHLTAAAQTRFAVGDLDSGVGLLRRAALRAADCATIRVPLGAPPPQQQQHAACARGPHAE